MITITIEDEDDVRSLFEIMMEMRQYLIVSVVNASAERSRAGMKNDYLL